MVGLANQSGSRVQFFVYLILLGGGGGPITSTFKSHNKGPVHTCMIEIIPIYQVGPPYANDRESIMHVCTVDRSVPQEYNGRLPGAIGWKVMEWGYIC